MPVLPGNRRQAVRGEHAADGVLRREPLEDLGPRTDERQVVDGAGLGEGGVLREEAVAGMDRVAAGDQRGADQRRLVEVRPP